jgi:hypothetical protein
MWRPAIALSAIVSVLFGLIVYTARVIRHMVAIAK